MTPDIYNRMIIERLHDPMARHPILGYERVERCVTLVVNWPMFMYFEDYPDKLPADCFMYTLGMDGVE